MGVVIAFGIFAVIWNARRFLTNHYFLMLGITFFFVSIVSLLHALAYKGMGVFTTMPGANLATQLWLVIGFLQSGGFFIAAFFINRQLKEYLTFYLFVALTALLLGLIFWWKIFPQAYIDGIGLTSFKKISELVIAAGYLTSLPSLFRYRAKFDHRVFNLLIWSIGLTFVAEILFIFYAGVYDYVNLLGHLFRTTAFYLIYMIILETGLVKPYRLMFKELKDNETALKKSEQTLKERGLELERLTDDLKKFGLAVADANDMITITDANGRIVYANRAAETMTGFERQEIIGHSPSLWGRRMSAEFYQNMWRVIKEEKNAYNGELVNRKKNGEIFIADLHISPVVDDSGDILYFVGIVRDITKAKEIDKAKTEFVSLASHQLRTPLTGISLASEMLLKHSTDWPADKQLKYIKEIHDSTSQMTELVDSLLNVSRLELGTFRLSPEPLDLAAELDAICDGLRLQAEDKKITLTRDFETGLPLVKFDRNSLRLIVDNLLSNALRYSPAGSTITAGLRRQNNAVVISVTDQGCGVPENAKNKIFDKQYRADNAKEINSDGAGLGLYIAKSVADKARANLTFESELNRGATFKLTINPAEMNIPPA